MTRPSSNWLALRKSLAHHSHPRERRKLDGVSSDATRSVPPHVRHDTDTPAEEVDLDTAEVKNGESIAALRKMVLGRVEYETSQTAPGKYLALDCEMVGVGIEGSESSLARVSIVNYTGAIMLDVFVRQREKVVDYRTQWSGVRSTDLAGSAKPFNEVQQAVADLIKDRILVGHAIYNDLKALLLSHPSPRIRDTQSLAYKHRVIKSRRPALRVLVKKELGIVIQAGEHNSVTDARATMALFRLYKKQWEGGFRSFHVLSTDDSASKTNTLSQSSRNSPPSYTRDRKRKRPNSPELECDDADGWPSSTTRTNSSSPSSAPKHMSTVDLLCKQKCKSEKQTVPTERKGISSGITTITTRAGSVKQVQKKGAQLGDSMRHGRFVENSFKGRKKTKITREKWWQSLGGGGKGGIKP